MKFSLRRKFVMILTVVLMLTMMPATTGAAVAAGKTSSSIVPETKYISALKDYKEENGYSV